jgi:hypothetical protein
MSASLAAGSEDAVAETSTDAKAAPRTAMFARIVVMIAPLEGIATDVTPAAD